MEGLLSFMLLQQLLLFWLSSVVQAGGPFNNVSDQHSLMGFKAALTLDPNNSMANWSPNISLCKWAGVNCSADMQRVVGLNLSHMGLEGVISPLVANLSALVSLDLSHNRLQGSIPAEISLLTHLEVLNLGENSITGTIPSSIGNLTALTYLDLSVTNLTSSIPPEVGMLTLLQILYLGINQLSGIIPSSVGNLSSLIELSLEENNLEGSIPVEMGMLSRLQILVLHTNQLSGNVPLSISNLSALTALDMSTNNLTGPIPPELGRLNKLYFLSIFKNLLTGPIPTSLLNCTSLIILGLYQNQLNGHIPSEIGAKLTNLQLLYLWENDLSGNIPSSLGNCSQLKYIDLGYNRLSGMVPIELGNLVLLEQIGIYRNRLGGGMNSSLDFLNALSNCSLINWMDVSYNFLSGVLRPSIGHLSSKLSYLDLAYNKLSGHIPQEINNLTGLFYLELRHNLLSGYIPTGIKSFHNLQRLYLSYNKLEGSLPDEIGEMHNLGLLDVSWNNLAGTIPDTLGRLKQLRELYLHHNHFSGVIPVGLEGCTNLELLDFSHNELRGNIPREVMASLKSLQFYLNLSGNFLQGPMPKEMNGLVSVQAIDISSNQLDGGITSVENCVALEYLNLSHNAFDGLIPDTFGKLQNLKDLDVSSNFLTGAIPMSLSQIREIHYINFGFNNLTGSIQEGGLFLNHTVIVLLMGNPGLCGPKKYMLPACQRQRQGKHSLPTKVILPVIGIITFIVCSLILGIIWRWKFSRQHFHLSNIMFGRLDYPKFSYEELFTATNGFSESNLLGVGTFGAVYKGILRDDKLVAVKVLNVQNEEGEKSFKTECKVLGKIRHRNLIRVISACSYPGFKGLVLQYASNGSLENHLYHHRNEENVCELGLIECLNIAIDVAHGIEYLHHDCSIQVVHCDLKPSNVLLDANMTALVTDFGISKFVDSTNSTDSALNGSIGYIAPEYGFAERVSTKGDVYSYGIMLLEMVTRKRPTDAMFYGGHNLHNWTRSAFPDRLADIVDNRLLSSVNLQQSNCLVPFIHVGLLCTKESPHERPTMRDIARGLESLRTSLMGRPAVLDSNLTANISFLVRDASGNEGSQSSSY